MTQHTNSERPEFAGLSANIAAVYRTIFRRRDVRAEFTGDPIDPSTLRRILTAGHAAPSVGQSQPWDFVIIQDPGRLEAFAHHVAERRDAFAAKLPEDRREVFNPIKIEGIRESGTGVVVTYSPERGGPNIIGRDTIDETGLMSVALAVQNMWLAATAEGCGLGWVSFYDADFLSEFVGCPEGVRAMAWLCVGPVTSLQEIPDLERFGWSKGLPLDDVVHQDRLS